MTVVACYCGDLTEGEKVLKSLRSFSSPILDAIQPMPFPQMQTLLDGAFPEGNYNYWKSTFLRELSDDAIALLVQQANRATSPLTGVVIEYYGGAAIRVGVSETAFAQRQAQHSIIFLAQWTNPGMGLTPLSGIYSISPPPSSFIGLNIIPAESCQSLSFSPAE